MKQLSARGDSNAARKSDATGAKDPDGGGAEKLGYILQEFPSTGPAESNSQLTITKDNFAFKQQNLGTSVSSYKHQPVDPDAETGK